MACVFGWMAKSKTTTRTDTTQSVPILDFRFTQMRFPHLWRRLCQVCCFLPSLLARCRRILQQCHVVCAWQVNMQTIAIARSPYKEKLQSFLDASRCGVARCRNTRGTIWLSPTADRHSWSVGPCRCFLVPSCSYRQSVIWSFRLQEEKLPLACWSSCPVSEIQRTVHVFTSFSGIAASQCHLKAKLRAALQDLAGFEFIWVQHQPCCCAVGGDVA